MEYTAENIRYCLLSFNHWQKQHDEQFSKKSPAISGLFQWCNVFGGAMDFPRTPEQFSKYNLVHVNITPRNLLLIPQIKKAIDPKITKLLINVDYSTDLWTNNFPYPEIFLEQIDRADYVFAVEEQMSELLTMHLRRYVPSIPHPSDLQGIGQFATTEREPVIGVQIHRYDKNLLLPWYAINNLQLDRSLYRTCALGGCYEASEVAHLYDNFLPHLPFPKMMETVARLFIAIETYTIRSYGRFSVECAALGIPVIGSRAVSSIRRCFPDLAIETNNIWKMASLLEQLTKDEDFYNKVATKAQENVDYYSYANCKKMMLEFLNAPQ